MSQPDNTNDQRIRIRPADQPITKGEFEERLTMLRNDTIDGVNIRFELLGSQILSKLDDLDTSIKNGFPDGDAAEHRRAHERTIEIEKERAELYKSIKEKIITSVVWGLLVLLGLASWEFIKQSIP
jgi:hypothetical protein